MNKVETAPSTEYISGPQQELKDKIETVVKSRDQAATNFEHILVVDNFVNVGKIYFTRYSSEQEDPEDSFIYTIVPEDPRPTLFCDDGVRLLHEIRTLLNQKRTFGQMIQDFHLYELITFLITLFLLIAFGFSLAYIVIFPYTYFFNEALAAMFLTILGFYFGKDIPFQTGSVIKSRIQSEILAALKLIHPSAASVTYKRVITRFLGVSVYYIEFTPTEGELEFSYAVVEPDGIEIYDDAEEVVLNMRSAVLRRKNFILRFEELGLFELAAATISILLSYSFLIIIELRIDPPIQLTGAMNLIIGYFFAKNAQSH